MSLPAVEAGLDLDQRVVRRHVAKLDAAGWLARAPWVWGEGSIAWLTGAGVEQAGLGGIRAVKSPPSPTTISHGVLVAWTAARVARRGRTWKSSRELALNRDRWAVRMRCERGYTEQLPDLAVWLKPFGSPVAVIAESGGRREDRQKMILEGWDYAIRSGRYASVHYDCASASVAHWIGRLAKKVRLRPPDFFAGVHMTAEEIAALSPAAEHDAAVDQPQRSAEAAPPREELVEIAPLSTQAPPAPPAPPDVSRPESAPPRPEPETADAAEARERLYRQIFGIEESLPRRLWRPMTNRLTCRRARRRLQKVGKQFRSAHAHSSRAGRVS